MAKKCKCPPPGAPDWMMTYGDMMSLLLCFFVLIVSFSEIKKEDEFRAVVEKIKQSFGMKGGGGRLPTDEDPALTLMKRLEEVELRQQRLKNRSNTVDPGMEGRESTVTRIREGMKFAIGGRIMFEPGSADLSEQAQAQLRSVVDKYKIRGTNNIIELRGHAASLELKQGDSPFADLWQLSYARAKAVMDYLVDQDIGLRRDRFRLIANADREPLAQRAYDASQQEPNRRVEIYVNEALLQAFQEPEAASSP